MKTHKPTAELWEWAEYFCPWCYIAATRLHKLAAEYEGRVRVVPRAYPLEVYGSGPANRAVLEAEIWLAAMQEPEAKFNPLPAELPATTLPAFEATWCALQQSNEAGLDLDLRIRRALFAEGRAIGKREVMVELAQEANLDMDRFLHLFNSEKPNEAVLAEGKLGKEQFRVRGTPTLMTSDGFKLRHPIAYPTMAEHKIIAVDPLPCCGDGCYVATRALFDKALERAAQHATATKEET